MRNRVLALVAAAAMVLGALAVRDRLDNDDSGGATGSGALKLVCASELQAVCDAIGGDVEVTIEPAWVTADRLQSVTPDEAGIDGWLAPGPWGEVVDTSRGPSAEELFEDADEPLARSPFVLAVWKGKRAVLSCGNPVEFACVGDAVIARGFRLGMAADDQAEGGLADAALGAGHVKNADFATNDLTETDLSDWLAAVDVATDDVGRNPGGRSFTELLTFGQAAADGYLATEAAIKPQFDAAARRGELDLVTLSPTATADVLFARRPGSRGDRLRDVVRGDAVRDALRANGWRVDASGSPRLPATDGLPSAGVLLALRGITR
jgi:hypothetical protein